MALIRFPAPAPDPALEQLRGRVQEFLAEERASGGFCPQPEAWMTYADPAFSERMAAKGWVGMTLPREYGGAGASAIERYIVTEEILRAGAPVAAHWMADRQHAPLILKYGNEAQKKEILPKIAAGKCYFAIGLSEPGAGSDLANVKTRAERTANGWLLNGQKIWSSGAHMSHYMVALVRTSPAEDRNRHVGLSQILIDLKSPGVTIRGIGDIAGEKHFNELFFDNVELPADALLGEEGGGWAQVTGELAMERSGPERFLSSYATFEAVLDRLQGAIDPQHHARLGRIVASLRALRAMSFAIATLLEEGASPETEAALMKEIGNRFERELTQNCRALIGDLGPDALGAELAQMLNLAVLRAPPNTLRGGTSEVMRGIIARRLGLR